MALFNRLLNDRRGPRLMLALVFVIGAAWILASRIPPAEKAEAARRTSPQEGFLAPDFTLETLTGERVMLSALHGKVVVVNLWASWCPPCRAEMPALNKIYLAHRDRGLEVLAVNAANQDSAAAAAAFVQQMGWAAPVLLDRDGRVGQQYRLRALPTTFFIDRQGVIRSIVVGGPMPEALIESKIVDLLGETP